MELLRQSLIDAGEREDGHVLALQAAQEEMEELRRRTIMFKMKYQELDDALEVQEGKTNAERLARQEAEEITRQHRAEVLEANRGETIANEHCDAAESEVLRLQRDLSTERSATLARDLLLCQLREDLELAEHNETAAYDQLEAAKAKICTLQENFGAATNRISMLECQARDLEEKFVKDHQRVGEKEKAPNAVLHQVRNSTAQSSDIAERYNGVKTKRNKCDFTKIGAATAFDTDRVGIDEESHVSHENGDPLNSKLESEPVPYIDGSMEETTVIKATSGVALSRMIFATETPALPEPAILRPALASVAICQVEPSKATGRVLAAPRSNLNHRPWRKYFWKLPLHSLHICFGGSD